MIYMRRLLRVLNPPHSDTESFTSHLNKLHSDDMQRFFFAIAGIVQRLVDLLERV